ncbi:MAG: tape measure protein [Bacteroidales bacterium]|nr:tape measure protein [Bacteroidales bacterium]
MENTDGALHFRATLDIDDFNVSAQAMENRIREFSSEAIDEVESVEDAFQSFAQKAGEYISYYLVGQGMVGLLNSIVQVRGQFQQLEIAFETMLGNSTKAQALMAQMVETAAKTPFDLMGVAEGAKQLMAYGVSADKVNDTLVRLGNIASGLSIPLNDIVYLYGTTMVQGRLYAQDVRQFTGRGIPLVKELAEKYGVTADKINEMVSAGKIGFPEVEEVLNKMTDAGGQFYNLMEKQSASLTGQIANLEDAWDTALNNLGEKGEGVFSAGISGATYLVEHLEDILRILSAITVAYGSYKAAVVLQTLVTKGYTGVALIDNTARSAKLALMKLEAVATGQVAAQTKAMTAAEEARVAALQQQLTAEENANLVKQLRINTIQQLLTVQQQEYLSNLNITTSSANYEEVVMGVLTVEQKLALNKVDLSSKSAIYRAALEQEVAAKNRTAQATISKLQIEQREALAAVESQKMKLLSARQAIATSRMELTMAQQTGDATKLVTAQKRVEVAVDAESAAQKRLLALQSTYSARTKLLEAAQSKAATTAAIAENNANKTLAVTKGILATATTKVTTTIRALWATMAANPIGAVLSVMGLLISAFMFFDKQTEETKTMTGEFNDTVDEGYAKLNTYFAILKTADSNTKTYRDALAKINAMCEEYKVALLEENSALEDQIQKHDELIEALERTTKTKIQAKYIEQEYAELREKQTKQLDELIKKAGEATHKEMQWTTEQTPEGVTTQMYKVVSVASESLRNATDALWDSVISETVEKSKQITSLTGDAYTQAVDALINQQMDKIQNATHASSAEMEAFQETLTKVLTTIISDAQDCNAELARIEEELSSFFGGAPDANEVVEQVDITKLSLEELHKLVEDLNGSTVTIDCKTYGFDTALVLLSAVKSEIQTKQNNLNTENGINSEISNLKKLRGEAELGSQKWKEYNEQITTLEKKLSTATGKGGKGGGRSGANDAARNAETLLQKQLEAAKRLEEARIAIMEEGYEKRKATLDLQHKDQLQRIDKEEKELTAARKKAGKGGLSQEEKNGFAEMRSLADQSYQRDQQNLLIAEIAEKKKQYQLYWRWVENMGKDVADKQFASLLTSGASYREYLDKQIQALKDKQASGQALSDGEQQQLFTLDLQIKEISGAKSAMDLFKESVTRTISQAQTLAEKLEAIAKAKEKLSNGTSGLVSEDDIADATLFLSQEDEKNQRELEDRLLTEFRTYEEKRKSITDEYALLRTEAERNGNAERIRIINEAENEALSSLNASMLKQSDSWKKLFQDLDSLSTDELSHLIGDFEKQLREADLKLSPVDYKALMDSLNQAKEELINKNPFQALETFYNDYIKAKERLALAKAKVAAGTGSDEDVKKAEADVRRSATGITNSIHKINEVAQSCGQSLQSMFDALGMDGVADGIGTAISLVGDLGNAAMSVGKFMSGDILGGITGMVSAVTSIVGTFAKLHDSKYEKRIQNLQKEIDALESSYNRLERAFNNTYWVFNEEERAGFEQNIKLINDQIDALERQREMALKAWNFTEYAKLTAEIKSLNEQLSKAKEGDDMWGLFNAQKENLKKQQDDLRKQIQAERSKKKSDDGKIQQWEDSIESITQQIEDLDRTMNETLAGTNTKTALDEFADALVEAYCKGEDAAEALGAKTKEVLKNAVVEALKRQYLAKAIDDAVQFLGSAMEDGTLDPWEKSKFEAMVNAAGDTFNAALDGIGDWIKDMEGVGDNNDDPLTGAIKGMSEQTADVLAGRANAIVINQSEMISIGKSALTYQAQIAENTRVANEKLDAIHNTLKNLDNNNSLLSQGIS